MANTIAGAEMVENAVTELKVLLASQEKLAATLNDGSIDSLMLHTKQLIEQNTATAKLMRDTAIDG